MKRNLILILGLLAVGAVKSQGVLVPQASLSGVRAYPCPWKANQHAGINVTIDRLPLDATSTVRIFTISGELVASLSGTGSVQWDLKNTSGRRVASGIYVYLVQVNGQHFSGKIAVIA